MAVETNDDAALGLEASYSIFPYEAQLLRAKTGHSRSSVPGIYCLEKPSGWNNVFWPLPSGSYDQLRCNDALRQRRGASMFQPSSQSIRTIAGIVATNNLCRCQMKSMRQTRQAHMRFSLRHQARRYKVDNCFLGDNVKGLYFSKATCSTYDHWSQTTGHPVRSGDRFASAVGPLADSCRSIGHLISSSVRT